MLDSVSCLSAIISSNHLLYTLAAPLPSPTNLIVSRRSPATSIGLIWDQPLGADAVTSYRIVYSYTVNECTGENRPFPPVTVVLNDGALRGYIIMNNHTSPVEEDSNYLITVSAINSVTESNPSNTAFTTTAEAGEITIHVLLIQNHHLNVSSTAPGLVQSLSASSVNVTNITIQWDRVNCLDRNGETDSYRIVYYPTLDPSDRSARTVAGTIDSDRMFTVTGLPPRTSYTFEAQASNPSLDVRGAPATLTVSTTAPQSELLVAILCI